MIEKLITNHQTLEQYRRFKSLKRSVISIWILFFLLFISITAEFWANSKPILLKYNGSWYTPFLRNYHPSQFNITDQYVMDYRQLKLKTNDFAIWPLIPWDPYESNTQVESYPSKPTKLNIFGTDDRGRDVLARLVYGFRYSIGYALLVWFFSLAIGTLTGALMGFIGGKVDLVGQRLVEIFESMPALLVLITLVSIFGANLGLLVVFSVFFGWMMMSTYMRAEFLKLRKRDFIEAARAQGVGSWRIVLRHILPNGLNPIITFSPFMIASEIYGLAALDYLGMGLPPPTPSWGELLQQAQNSFTIAWWLALYPSLAMILTLTALNLVGEGVRNAFDPRKSKSH
ncbi:MAG: ABC transporter permease subunit [Bdellovibrionales bacterium]|nr:ABC transporter permease subunit [Bdellovibrionales bacterium]